MTFYGLAIFVFWIAFTNLVEACPLGQLAALSKETLGELRRVELPAADNDSTEGGQWQIFIRDDASLHSILRLDFGETGQRQIRLSMLNRRDFAITLNNLRYDTPLNPNDRVDTDTANKISKEYFFCGEIAYIPVDIADDSSAVTNSDEAKKLKATFFSSIELVPYLSRSR